MNQNEFFNILMDDLKDFPEEKLQDIISHYEKKFTAGFISGITEEEIIKELGTPKLIVEKYRNEQLNTNLNSELSTNDIINACTNSETFNTDSNNTDETSFKNQNTIIYDKELCPFHYCIFTAFHKLLAP